MRSLPFMQRSRAALASVAGHCALFAALTFIGIRATPTRTESPLIVAELVTTLEPAAPPAPRAETESGERVPAERTLEPLDIPHAPDRAEESAPAPEPPSPPPETPRERAVTPPALPPVERVADEPPPVERAPDVPPAEASEEPALAEALEEPAAPPVPTETVPEPPAPLPEPAVAEAAPPELPTRALASREERAVHRHLSSWTGRLDAAEPDTTLAWRDDGQEYTAVLTRIPAADAMGMEQLLVELTTQRDGERLVTEMRMNRIAFSNFAQFIDRWDPEVEIHDDVIDGRFHSNSEIRVSRERGVQPVFNGKVTVAAGDVRTGGVGYLNRRTMFPAGVETRVRRIVLPPRAAAFDDGTVPADRSWRIERDTLLTFHADGTFDAAPLAQDAPAAGGALGDDPFYFLGPEDVEVHVRGTVNGKVLVYSRETIAIADDVRYAADPRLPGADDYLGLVAERTVEVAAPEVTGPGDLEIHASIYARNRFAVRDYRSRLSGTLIIYGSVTAGSLTATEPRFATRIEFDDRLTTMRAPGFPLSDRYELHSTSGEWRVVDAQ